MKLRWILIIFSGLFSCCEDAQIPRDATQRQVEGELEALFTDLYEVAQSEPEYLHAPNEMRAEYEERKRELESGNLSISKEGLADFLEFIQRSEKKADRLSSIRNRIEAIMKENPEVETHEISRKAALATGIDGPSDKGEADPFR